MNLYTEIEILHLHPLIAQPNFFIIRGLLKAIKSKQGSRTTHLQVNVLVMNLFSARKIFSSIFPRSDGFFAFGAPNKVVCVLWTARFYLNKVLHNSNFEIVDYFVCKIGRIRVQLRKNCTLKNQSDSSILMRFAIMGKNCGIY